MYTHRPQISQNSTAAKKEIQKVTVTTPYSPSSSKMEQPSKAQQQELTEKLYQHAQKQVQYKEQLKGWYDRK